MSHSDVFQFGGMAFAEFFFMAIRRCLKYCGYSSALPSLNVVLFVDDFAWFEFNVLYFFTLVLLLCNMEEILAFDGLAKSH